MDITTHIKNIGLIDDITAEFKAGNIYIVKGQNNKGKTTFINSLTSGLTGKVIKDKLSHGETNGSEEFLITGLDNKTYKVVINHKQGKNPSFTIIYPNLSKSSRKGDLASIFQYTPLNTETFAGLGLTEPGRRKQAEYFIKLMPTEIQERLLTLDAEINTAHGTLYIDRRDKANEIKYLKQNSPTPPTKEQTDIVGNINQWIIDVENMEAEYDKTIEAKNKAELEIQQYANKSNNLNFRKEEIEDQIAKLQGELMGVEDTLSSLVEPEPFTIDEQGLLGKKEEIRLSHEAIFTAQEARSSIERYNVSNSKLIKLEKAYAVCDELLDSKRKLKAKMISENLNMNHISIEDGQLLFKDESGEYPINEDRLSYSRIAMIVADLTIKLNPNYPIVCLGKAAEFDETSMEKLLKYAKATKSIIVLDKVEGNGELKINVYEE